MKNKLLILFLLIGLKGFSCISYDTIYQAICPTDSFLFNGTYYKSAGLYYDTLTNAANCDSFVTLDLSIYPSLGGTTINDSFCVNHYYLFGGDTLRTIGIFYDTLKNVTNCDSIVELRLTNKAMITPTIFYDTICNTDSIYFNDKWNKYPSPLGSDRVLYDTLIGASGCDSLLVLFLRVNGTSNYFRPPFQPYYGCMNKPFLIGDTSFVTDGMKNIILKGANRFGCDSSMTFWVTRRDTHFTSLFRVRCSDDPFFFNGEMRNASGVYLDTLVNRFGCDSFIELNLTINPVKDTTFSTYFCENYPYFFNNQYITVSGTYKDTLKTSDNCDSFVTVNLTKRKTNSFTLYHKFCINNPYFFNGQLITVPGTYLDTLVNADLCDSFLTVVLSMDTVSTTTVNKTICYYDSLYFGTGYIKTAGTYSHTLKAAGGCDSVVTMNLSLHPNRTIQLTLIQPNLMIADTSFIGYKWYYNNYFQQNATQDTLIVTNLGNYFVIGIDTNQCQFKSNTVNFNGTSSIHRIGTSSYSIYPIPASNYLYIASKEFTKGAKIEIYSLDGRIVYSNTYSNTNEGISLDISSISSGNYILKFKLKDRVIEERIEIGR